MSTLFMFSFILYLISLAFSEATLSYKLLILFRDLLILGVISQFFNYVRKNSMLVLVSAIVVYGLIQFVGFNMLFDTFPQYTASSSEVDDEFEFLVETEDGKIPKAYNRLIREYNLNIREAFTPADPSASRLDEFIAIGIPDVSEKRTQDIYRKLSAIEGTEHVEFNEVIKLELRQDVAITSPISAKHVNDPMVGQQWGWDMVQGDKLHEMINSMKPKARKKALIAIIDSGVDATHPDLRDQFVSLNTQYDSDPLGHGTHCAGIAGAVSNNQVGIASLVPNSSYVNVTSIKVMNSMGVGTQLATINGMIKAVDMGADVLSMSLGGPVTASKRLMKRQ